MHFNCKINKKIENDEEVVVHVMVVLNESIHSNHGKITPQITVELNKNENNWVSVSEVNKKNTKKNQLI